MSPDVPSPTASSDRSHARRKRNLAVWASAVDTQWRPHPPACGVRAGAQGEAGLSRTGAVGHGHGGRGGDGGARAAHEPKPDSLLDDSRLSPFWEKRTTRDGAQAAEDRDAEASTIVVKQGRGGGDAWNFRNLGALLARPQVSQPHPTAGVY